jgi:hypothetical protein
MMVKRNPIRPYLVDVSAGGPRHLNPEIESDRSLLPLDPPLLMTKEIRILGYSREELICITDSIVLIAYSTLCEIQGLDSNRETNLQYIGK